MAGETIKCPHCECKVKVSDVEKEDGFCPECGQLVMASSLQNDFDNDLDEEQPDILDELNDDSLLDDEGMPRKRHRSGGVGFRQPNSNPSPKRGRKK